ncbi:hypothetical protein Celaphus_00003214 [Cervus elaphus hippelaphus]|uniref:Uncharacterized protein n=1 Tax=Cervus elaphus hippelaphus TaxID=46360 RepID=A0A212D1R9_CEREH|nr:hypothetical protein Celaphus_00003214 [Cervus elaphus hippelaphus]
MPGARRRGCPGLKDAAAGGGPGDPQRPEALEPGPPGPAGRTRGSCWVTPRHHASGITLGAVFTVAVATVLAKTLAVIQAFKARKPGRTMRRLLPSIRSLEPPSPALRPV